jgi:hypothetical protein
MEVDAEGMVLRGDEVLVSFERRHRVDIYPADRPGGQRRSGLCRSSFRKANSGATGVWK